MASKETKRDKALPIITYKNLGKGRPSHKKRARTPFGIWTQGNTNTPGRIVIDPRQTEYEMMDTIIHECLHETQPEITEDGIVRISKLISRVLWKEGYRQAARNKDLDNK
jgi:hypothetical protein